MARYLAAGGTFVLAAVVILWAGDVAAFEPAGAPPAPSEEDAARPQRTAFFGILGGRVGLGVEVVRRFGDHFELTAGGGLSPSKFTDSGGQASSPFTWSVMPRLRLNGSKLSLTMGAGLSGGPETQKSSCGFADDSCTIVTERAGYLTRLDGELGVERWSPSGFALRVFAGYGYVIDPQDFRCVASAPPCAQGSGSGLYVGLGLGYAF